MGNTPPPRPAEVRNSAGRHIRTPEQVERDAYAASLRGEGLSYATIARRLGISKPNAWQAVQRAFRDTLTEPAEQARAVELARLEDAHDKAVEVLLRKHVTVSHGRIIVGEDGIPLIDDGPVLAAIDRIRALSESRRKLLGLDAPRKMEVLTIDAIDQQIRDLTDELAAAADSETGAFADAEDPQG